MQAQEQEDAAGPGGRKRERSGADADLGKTRQASLLGDIEFTHHLVNVAALLSEIVASRLDFMHGLLQLVDFGRRAMEQVLHVPDFGKRQPDATAAQDLLDQYTLLFAVEPRAPAPLGLSASP